MSSTIYEAAGGRRAFIALAHAWHARCLADPIVSHAFSHGYRPKHSERLAAYWAEALGGRSDYTVSMGNQTGVVRMHSGNGEHVEMDERAQVCFALALDDAALPDDPRLPGCTQGLFSVGDPGNVGLSGLRTEGSGWSGSWAGVLGRPGVNWRRARLLAPSC
jgi:hemoglobin